MNLRFINRDGKKILQYQGEKYFVGEWIDVPFGECQSDPEPSRIIPHPAARECICGEVKISGELPSLLTPDGSFHSYLGPCRMACKHRWSTDFEKVRCDRCGVRLFDKQTPKEFWLIAGRYFESRSDAEMWFYTKGAYPEIEKEIIHVKECE